MLIVDDDRNTRESLGRALRRDGYEVLVAEHGKAALALAQDHHVDLVLTDLKMPGLDGLDLIESLKVVCPDVSSILISAFASVDTAVKAVRRGVRDVLEKPIRLRDVRRAIKRAFEDRPPAGERRRALSGRTAPATQHASGNGRPLIGASEAFLEILDVVDRVAPASSTALLLGESGTGKELIAEALHARSPRSDRPLVKVACAALAEGVLEAELFGNERGAYTGAHEQRKGRFELAHGGTIFLDEIGEIDLPLQVKLLRVLQEGEFERVGGSTTIRTDVRVIAATNRDLEAEARAGRFREDLFWRLNVIAIRVPTLLERHADIPLLAEHFLAKMRARTGRQLAGFDDGVIDALQAYRWPGNVRELENAIERAVVLTRGDRITLADLPPAVRGVPSEAAAAAGAGSGVIRFEVGQSLGALEREAILRTLDAVGGNREAAASILGIGTATLYRRLKEMEEDAAGE
ncbi:MAG: sigma-54-dependent Fis family transcriptional regulator [Planctomycetes bacterium]|nr:sigma-54-dependent Fis family transcriptional regulator [Planctomycetota bacterium]MCB9824719.1 sigma-54-dependent Fis family transcriptional regulator [Planctomycetota bacterium]MCB9899870.1 sigma-54-dependent Fis family transcriptional regulator [Planctomycetota bacterium]